MFELIVIWQSGERDIYTYNTREEAEQAGRNMRMAFGTQVAWTGTREKRR